MATAHQIIHARGCTDHEVVTIRPESSVYDAAVRMNNHQIGSLVVVGPDGGVIGMFTERDVLKRVVATEVDPRSTSVASVMTSEVVVCDPETRVEELRATMRARRIRHIPVVARDGTLLGMVSIGDLNAHEAREMEQTIHYLERYMTAM
jgi:CBS domain-containing protein